MTRTLRATLSRLCPACALIATASADDPPWVVRSRSGMVASDSPAASRIGAAVLKAGGNAFDAAVATSLALAVARPQSTGLGGGGFMLAWTAAPRRLVALDFRETAPAAASPARYAELSSRRGDGPPASVYGGNAVGVPGQLAGLAEISRRFGTRPLAELLQPALELAERGFPVDQHFRQACQTVRRVLDRWPALRPTAGPLLRLIMTDGQPPAIGQRLKRPGLARALRLIADRGPAAVYDGPIGEAIVQAVRAGGGAMTAADLRGYRVRPRRPIRFRYQRFEIASMPPPSSGGVCLAEMFQILQAAAARDDLDPLGDRPHLLIEAMKHAFADRARWLGDPDFADLPVARLTSRTYAAELARRIDPTRTLAPPAYGSAPPTADDRGTSHFCVADRFGNVVALTETINGHFGSLLLAEPYGIVLNNELDDFLTLPGKPNLYGLLQSRANLIGPGKRPLSSMSPTIILKDRRPLLALGASGGPRIISSVFTTALLVLEGHSLAAAIRSQRLHHQWQPDMVYLDRPPPDDTLIKYLQRRGHRLSGQYQTGLVQAIRFLDDGTMVGASDPRKGGRPAGAAPGEAFGPRDPLAAGR